MPHPSNAEIIPFPVRRIEQVGRERLERSLARLQMAAAEQAAAVSAWRDQLARLHDGVGALGHSFGEYNARLGEAKQGIDALNAEARRLESWADGVLAR